MWTRCHHPRVATVTAEPVSVARRQVPGAVPGWSRNIDPRRALAVHQRCAGTEAVLALQRLAGNAATAELLAHRGAVPVGAVAAGGPLLAQGIPPFRVPPRPPTLEDLPSLILGTPCFPYTSRVVAEAAFAFVVRTWMPFASGVFGSETAALWQVYLDRASPAIPRPAQTLSGRPTITAGFSGHHKTAEAEEALVREVINAVNGGAVAVTPGVPQRLPLDAAIGATTASGMLGKGGSQEMSFDQPATTIPGNIAGGVGEGGSPGNTSTDPDTRDARGDVEILVTPGPGGGPGTVSVRPLFTFHVHDTVDFCPGALGGLLARAETVPMSRLEATEATLGPVYAADVPFDVDFPGPGTTRTAPHTPPPPPSPPPPVVLPTTVLFDFDSAVVNEDGKRTLRDLLPQLRAAPTSQIVGHTDSRGSDAYNQRLSERRARAAVDELVAQDPTLAGRLLPVGRGEGEPVDTNDTAAGRSRNRRIEVVFGP